MKLAGSGIDEVRLWNLSMSLQDVVNEMNQMQLPLDEEGQEKLFNKIQRMNEIYGIIIDIICCNPKMTEFLNEYSEGQIKIDTYCE